MPYEKVPPLGVMQRLFVDRWWSNGGNMIEAIEFAGYEIETPSKKAGKGRKILSLPCVRSYIDYLRQKDKQERRAREEAIAKQAAHAAVEAARETDFRKVADLVMCKNGPVGEQTRVVEGASGVGPAAQLEQTQQSSGRTVTGYESIEAKPSIQSTVAASGASVADSASEGRAEPCRAYTMQDVSERAIGTLLPPTIMLPATGEARYGRELCPVEVREILANVARGNEPGMEDARVRMRAIELAMKNLGMLVDLSVRASVDSDRRTTLSAEERDAEVQRLEAYITKVKKARLEKK